MRPLGAWGSKQMRFVGFVVAALAVALGAAHAQPTDIPRTSEGRPDFHGVWSNEFLTTLERITGATSVAVSDEEAERLLNVILTERAKDKFEDAAAFPEARQLARVKGEWRTSLVVEPVDGLVPLTEQGKALRAAFPALTARTADNHEERGSTERCLAGPSRAPIIVPLEGMYNQIVQTQDHLLFFPDHYNDLRIIGIGAKHRAPALVAWAGDSIAHWDGDTLVVETTGFNPIEPVRHRLVFGPASRVIERFQLLSADELLYQFTIEDPALYAKPWLAEYTFQRSNLQVHEFACHEGNYGLPGILLGERRVAELQAATAQPQPKTKANQ